MKQKDNHKILCDKAKKIQDILIKNNFEIVEGPNIGNVLCYWLVEQGQPYHTGVYISKK
jgi:hypothetical protein